ncbi:carboxylesterase family protein [Actinomadura darangshiensis]|uniref:Carboxylic ester hydrolase n=1 Tax=Actinomadura darangshiensis TaxID=705336 RepID=A0A4R5AQQ1_9ACTN|nr:carboxylesterase family protein [Actinomadura darangshiensis]TDD75408.1 carboxylesterase family protein [Actinomadura darangshiensis]
MKAWNRRLPLALLTLTGTVGATAACAAGQTAQLSAGKASAYVVWTEDGAVRGKPDGNVRVFQGIPYAAPPVGKLRWTDPQPPEPWKNVRDATRPGPACPQNPGEIPSGSKNEDCLNLNVTAPSGAPAKPKPVVVWVHGGGYYMGAGSNYGAQRMAAKGDVVVVTVNYRLGVFGFFGHPGLKGSGTYGLKDQQAALSWVQRNIARFGGDPGNVTLAGQSAGGLSGCAQLTSPGAKGLFHKVIMQSGSCSVGWLRNFDYRGQTPEKIFQPVATVRQRGRRTAAELGCTGGDAAVIACMRGLPVDKLLPVLERDMHPAYGNAVLPVRPSDAVRTGRFHRVPVLSGHTRDESTQSTAVYDDAGAGQRKPMTEQTFDTVMAETFGKDEAAVRAEYPRSSYDSAALAWSAIVTDRKWASAQYDMARDLSRRVPVYQYLFADPNPPALSPAPPKMPMGAQHASELWYLFDLGGMPPALDPEQQRLAEQMIGYWTAFAASGDPGKAGGPRWPRFRTAGNRTPYVQALAPGSGGIRPVDTAAEHHLGFWAALGI